MTLRRAVQIAAVALQDQTDEASRPFILHALRASSTEEKRLVTLLHEVVGHSKGTHHNLLRENVPDTVPDAVHALTLAGGETRASFVDHLNRR